MARLINVIGRWESRAGRTGGVPAGRGGRSLAGKAGTCHPGTRKLLEPLSARQRQGAERQADPMRDRAD